VQEGAGLYISNCVFCHGIPGVDRGGNIKNLGYITADELGDLGKIVFNGPFVQQGMPDFTGKLTTEQLTKIQAFIQGTADAIRPK
jgi:quinohemoprotein ethanol dehydrogenase